MKCFSQYIWSFSKFSYIFENTVSQKIKKRKKKIEKIHMDFEKSTKCTYILKGGRRLELINNRFFLQFFLSTYVLLRYTPNFILKFGKLYKLWQLWLSCFGACFNALHCAFLKTDATISRILIIRSGTNIVN